jgi:hypothetical protein
MPGLRDRLRAFLDGFGIGPPATTSTTTVTAGGPRAAGPPRSANGASSFHLIWEMPRTPAAARLVEVSVVFEVLVAPRVPSLYFWALQVDFEEDGLIWGGGHTGLQWNQRFPDHAAVNWGGYAAQELGGAVLAGTEPILRTFPGDPNTAAFRWMAGRPYRLRVYRSPDLVGAWRAEIADLTTGHTTVIRDLMRPGRAAAAVGRAGAGPHRGYLRRPLVWSEVFADCDAASVTVRWSDLAAINEEGLTVRPEAVQVNYQAHHDGGCSNTTVRQDGTGLLQITNTAREILQGTRLTLGRDGP